MKLDGKAQVPATSTNDGLASGGMENCMGQSAYEKFPNDAISKNKQNKTRNLARRDCST